MEKKDLEIDNMAKKGKYQRVVVKKMPLWKSTLLVILSVILLLTVSAVGFGVLYYKDLLGYVSRAERQEQELSDAELEEILGFVPETLPETEPAETTEAPEETEPRESQWGKTGKIVNIMLVGQAMREQEDSKLSDTMILCTINKETKTLTLTSFLRDTYIKLPNYKNHVCGMQRINVAYNLGWRWAGDLGGMEMLNQLVYESFGVEVDHNVEINFNSFVEIIDLLGGVTVNLSQDEANYLNAANFSQKVTEGENTLPGDIALEYARMRKSSGSDSDIHRAQRQRNLITTIIKRCMSMNLGEIDKLIKQILPMVLTNMSDEDITTLMVELLPLLPELTIQSNQCPAEGTYYGEMVQIAGMDAAVLIPDVEVNRELLMALCEETEEIPGNS